MTTTPENKKNETKLIQDSKEATPDVITDKPAKEVPNTEAEQKEQAPDIVKTQNNKSVKAPEKTTTVAKIKPSGILVVISAVVKESEAVKIADGLRSKGYSAGYLWIPDYESSGKNMYRVYAGPYATQAAAKEAQTEIKKQYPGAYFYDVK